MVDTLGLEPSARKGREGSNPSSCTIAWAAGLFEGEGCFFVNKVRKRGKEYKYPAAIIKMTDLDVLEKFNEIIGLGKIWEHKSNVSKSNWKPSWWWRCHGDDVSKLAKMILPWLCSRRVEQYERVMRECKPL